MGNDMGYSNKDYWQLPEALAWLEGKPADLSLLDDDKDLQQRYKIWIDSDTARDKPYYWGEKKWNRPNHPSVGICWYEALAFCHWLNSMDEYQDKPVRLPTEAEWEYAARGTQGLNYACGNDINKELANYKDTGLERTSAVGLFPVGEAFAEQGVQLYDMTGNVWEWTQSQWGKQSKQPDFTYEKWVKQGGERNNPEPHALRITRGGSWYGTTDDARCAFRGWLLPYFRNGVTGFRVVRE